MPESLGRFLDVFLREFWREAALAIHRMAVDP
jgi:hypothetical protein